MAYGTDKERWLAVQGRDRLADGVFYYAVQSTGVYCRPWCGARQPRRENVRFFDTRGAAEKEGFRPCKRCRPNLERTELPQARAIEEACRKLASEDKPDLDRIAAEAGMSRFHFQRVFKETTGITPHAYFAAHRRERVQQELAKSRTVTDAIYGAGFQSNGRFYAKSNELLGMKPKAFQEAGSRVTIRFAIGECSLGSILVAATEKGVCSILLGDEPSKLLGDLERRFAGANLIGGDAEFEELVARVIAQVEQPGRALYLPLDIRGTAFQEQVWQALREIPAGKTASYEEIAERIGAPRSVRAVAQACASNQLAVAIPCHRVVRKDGALGGYRWGIERKTALLERERQSV
ncbi:MAG TPA: bifunctional DNA-binding transcriptional regulator/O6-methylguanine-DNA methyltransferase Ada [Bryobacteraceae bacterium]|jgi:AraC family transcriptional regulator of adaptative response/methylated-DNA-[protein]-cysteine methyltransferase|nr:bifunctional DNA-binding transcriptional regulator/O6-methylguanine-DNA methyltransferase Ada [Bryobacteraceae bacterium]